MLVDTEMLVAAETVAMAAVAAVAGPLTLTVLGMLSWQSWWLLL